MKDPAIRSHKDLVVWQKSMRLVEEVYRCTKSFPGEERFGLSLQMRRSAVSVASNIAEGSARQSSREFLQFLCIARASLAELETQFEIARRLDYIQSQVAQNLSLDDVGRTLTGLIKRIRANLRPQ